MNWFFYAGLCALFYGIEGVYLKYLHRKGIDELTLAFALFFYSVPLLFIPAALHGFSPPDKNFLFLLLLVTVGNSFGFFFYSKAIKNAEVSLVMPVLAVSPVLVVPFSWLLIRELPPTGGIAGLAFITIGLFFLSFRGKREVSFSVLLKNKGVRFAVLTLFIWAVVANMDKLVLQKSHPLVYPFYSVLGITLCFSIVAPAGRIFRREHLPLFIGLGIVHAGLFLTHMLALNSGYVSYLIAVKRSGMLVAVFLGWLIFHEKNIRNKFAASLLILAGIFLLLKK